MSFEINRKQYVDYIVYGVTKIKDKYGFRVKLIYDDGTTELQQKSGYKTKKDAENDRNIIVAQLYNRSYAVYPKSVSVKDFFEYWLEEVMAKREKFSYNSYLSYRNIIRNYLIPFCGNVKLTTLNISHIEKFYKKVSDKSDTIARLSKTVLKTGLEYAEHKGVINKNIAIDINLPKKIKRKEYRTRKIDTAKTLNIEQAKLLIEASKSTPIHLQIMFALLMGMRLSEINGVKYSDIDFINRRLNVTRQLGVNLQERKQEDERLKSENKKITRRPRKDHTKQEVRLKTKNSYRCIDIPDILFEAIIEEQKKYEKNKRRRINCKTTPFIDDNYICCSTFGHSRSKGFHQKYYAKLLEENNLPKIRFHDLRHTYGTILLKANFDAKAVSKILGHSSEIITVDVYCDTEEIIYDCLETLEPFISEIAPISNEGINNLSLDEELDYAYNNIENIVYNI